MELELEKQLLTRDIDLKKKQDSAVQSKKRSQQLRMKQALMRQIREQNEKILDQDNPGNREYALNQKIIRQLKGQLI